MYRCYTEHDMGYGALEVKAMMAKMKDLGYSTFLVSDHGLSSSFSVMMESQALGLSPMIGLDVEVLGPWGDELMTTLVAHDEAGFRVLSKISAYSTKEKLTQDVLLTFLRGQGEHLSMVTGGYTKTHRSLLGYAILMNKDEAKAAILSLAEEVTLYFEVFDHGSPTDRRLYEAYKVMASKDPSKIILGHISKYAEPSDRRLLLSLISIAFAQKNKYPMPLEQVERAVEQNLHLVDEANWLADGILTKAEKETLLANTKAGYFTKHVPYGFTGKKYYPEPKVADGQTVKEAFREAVYAGFSEHFGDPRAWKAKDPATFAKYAQRLKNEMDVIDKTGFAGYLLVVQDFIRSTMKAHPEDVATIGKGRGSGVGSLVLYCLYITDVDPLRFDLLFERFLNVDRISDPDIDTDFRPDLRNLAVEHCVRVYGEDHVAGISTKMTFAARYSVHDASRILGGAKDLTHKLVHFIPELPGIELQEALDQVTELQQVLRESQEARDIWSLALALEGKIRSMSVHAAGKIISSVPVDQVVPLMWDENNQVWVTQWTGPECEKAGLLKMDFLGLESLAIIENAMQLIREEEGLSFDPWHLPLDDEATLNVYREGHTQGVFQFESPGMKKMLLDFQPNSFDELILLNAAYRPGPMQYLPHMLAVKRGEIPFTTPLPEWETILRPTYGKPVYQEQVMQMFQAVGFTLGEADVIRAAIAKKKLDKLESYKVRFLTECAKRGMVDTDAFWAELLEFGRYAFNKSHATAYAFTSFTMAYLKAHYPYAFYAAAIESEEKAKLPILMQEARQRGIRFQSPTLAKAKANVYGFLDGTTPTIMWGFSRVAYMGKAIPLLLEEREREAFFSIEDFLFRMAPKMNVRGFRSMAQAGSFSSMASLSTLMAIADQWPLVKASIAKHKKPPKKPKKGAPLEAILPKEPWKLEEAWFVEAKRYSMMDRMQMEKEALGDFLTTFPEWEALRWQQAIDPEAIFSTIEGDMTDRRRMIVRVEEVRTLYRKKDNAPMRSLTFSDGQQLAKGILFVKETEKYGHLLEKDAILRIIAQKKEEDFHILEVQWLPCVPSLVIPVRSKAMVLQLEELAVRHACEEGAIVTMTHGPRTKTLAHPVDLAFVQALTALNIPFSCA